MTAIVYPSTLPSPSVATITSAERRVLAPDAGPFDARAVQRDRLATQQITFPPFTASEAAIFRQWWRDTLSRGGASFASSWPLPQGGVGVRKFIGAPTWRKVDKFWQISATCEVRGRGLAPVRHTAGDWADRALPVAGEWQYTAWSEELGLFCAVAVGALCATSPDGIVWTARAMPSSASWSRIVWAPEIGLFVAVAYSSTNAATSPDGINWTGVTIPSGYWSGLAWNGSSLVLMDNAGGAGATRVLTSPDGQTWTARASAMPASAAWDGVVWAPRLGVFCAVASFSTHAATSPDGVTWTAQTLPSSSYWREIAWSEALSLFVVTDYNAAASHCLTSPDGVAWTSRSLPVSTKWGSVCWNDTRGLFCMVGNGTQSLFSSDGITWTASDMGSDQAWYTVVWGHGAGAFVALADETTALANSRQYD